MIRCSDRKGISARVRIFFFPPPQKRVLRNNFQHSVFLGSPCRSHHYLQVPNTVTPCPERPFPIVPLHTFGQRLATYYFSRSALESVVVWLRGHPEPWSQLHQSLREHLSRVRLRYLIRRRHMFNTREYTGHRLVTGMPPPAALKPFPVCFWRILSQRRPCDIVYRANTFHGCLSPSDVRLGGGGGISQNHNKTGAETHFSTDKYIFPFFPVGWHADSVERRLLQRVDCPQSL